MLLQKIPGNGNFIINNLSNDINLRLFQDEFVVKKRFLTSAGVKKPDENIFYTQ